MKKQLSLIIALCCISFSQPTQCADQRLKQPLPNELIKRFEENAKYEEETGKRPDHDLRSPFEITYGRGRGEGKNYHDDYKAHKQIRNDYEFVDASSTTPNDDIPSTGLPATAGLWATAAWLLGSK